MVGNSKTEKATTSQATDQRPGGWLGRIKNFSGVQLVFFALVFGVIGSSLLYLSMASSHSERVSDLEGTLEVLVTDDFKNKSATYDYSLKTANGNRYKLTFGDQRPELISGSKVRVSGQN